MFCGRNCEKLAAYGPHKVESGRPALCYGPALVRAAPVGIAGIVAVVLLAVSGATAAGPGRLKQQLGAIESQKRSAALDLYALDSRITAAQHDEQTLQQQADALRRQQQLLQQRIGATRHTLETSRRDLGAHLRELYREGNVNALAVMLGARSLDDAISQLDALDEVATQSKQVMVATLAAQQRLTSLRIALVSRRTQLQTAVSSARRTLVDLESSRTQRVAFITRLQTAEQLKSSQIAALEARVARAQAKSQQLQSAATTSPPTSTDAAETTTAATPPAPAPAPAAPSGGRTITVSSTGYSLPGHTATGLPVGWGVVAVDPSVIPLGTKMTIPGYGEGVAADTGSAVRGRDIDLWFPTLAQAQAWGRRTVTITLH